MLNPIALNLLTVSVDDGRCRVRLAVTGQELKIISIVQLGAAVMDEPCVMGDQAVLSLAEDFIQHRDRHNVSLDNRYTVLDISSLTGDLLTVGMFVALDFVWDRAKEDRTEEKTIFIDECWQLLSGAGATGTRLAGDFVLEIFKTIRGYGGSAVCASQDLNDFFNLDEGRFGKGIINNSKTKIILNLEDDEAMRVQSALHLSDAEVMEVTHFERGNGLISTNNNNIMVEFKASPLEKDLITTDRRELKDIVERMRRQSEAG